MLGEIYWLLNAKTQYDSSLLLLLCHSDLLPTMASSSETKKNLVDQVTPYKIGVLLLIDEYCRVLARMVNGQYQLTDIMSESQERELMICLLHLVQASLTSLSVPRQCT